MPRVTVVLPVYNGEAYLEAALRSVLSQTFRDLEIVVVDDGSTDRSASIAEGVRDPRVRVVRQDNRGLAAARNAGIREGRGDLVALIDADDLWLPRKLERQIARMDADAACGLVYGWHLLVDSAGRRIGASRPRLEGDLLRALALRNVIGPPSNVIFRRSVLNRGGPYDEAAELRSGCEDWDQNLRVAALATVACVPAYLLLYRVHSANMNHATRIQAMLYVMEKLLARHPELEPLRGRIVAGIHCEIALKHYAQGRMAAAREEMLRSLAADRRTGTLRRRALLLATRLPMAASAYRRIKRRVNASIGLPAALLATAGAGEPGTP